MRKTVLSLYIALAFVLFGCQSDQEHMIKENARYTHDGITEFTYKGHSYIAIRRGYGNSVWGGITHDPDCPCHAKDTVETTK